MRMANKPTEENDQSAGFIKKVLDVGLHGATRMSTTGPVNIMRGLDMLADRRTCDIMITIRMKAEESLFVPDEGDDEESNNVVIIEWKVHRAILRQSPVLANLFFPSDGPERRNIRLRYHPLAIDSVVCFFYTGQFCFDFAEYHAGDHKLKHATFIPDNVFYQWKKSQWKNLSYIYFLCWMYRIGGILGEPNMMDLAIMKISEIWLPATFKPAEVKHAVEALYVENWCVDRDRKLKGMAVALAAVHVTLRWDREEIAEFEDLCKGLNDFLVELEKAMGEVADSVREQQQPGSLQVEADQHADDCEDPLYCSC